jgi:hypothetical protein
MDFVVNELILIMFFVFVLMLVFSLMLTLFLYQKLLIKESDFTPYLGNRPKELKHMPNFGIFPQNHEILKERYNHFKER